MLAAARHLGGLVSLVWGTPPLHHLSRPVSHQLHPMPQSGDPRLVLCSPIAAHVEDMFVIVSE